MFGVNSLGSPTSRLAFNIASNCRHEAIFYRDERTLLDRVTRFVGAALKVGNAAIVLATEPRRDSLLLSLQHYGLDVGDLVMQGRFFALDAGDVLATSMRNRMPDPVLFVRALDPLILSATKVAKAEDPRVAIFGECVHLLWAHGNAEVAIQMEKLGNQLAKAYSVDILCGY